MHGAITLDSEAPLPTVVPPPQRSGARVHENAHCNESTELSRHSMVRLRQGLRRISSEPAGAASDDWKRPPTRVTSNSDECSTLYKTLCELQLPGFARDQDTGETLGVLQLRQDGTLLVPHPLENRAFVAQVASRSAAYRFLFTPDGPNEPREIVQYSQRGQLRSPVCRRVTAAFSHPDSPTQWLENSVIDVASGGLSFWLATGAQALEPGTRLSEIHLGWKGGEGLNFSAIVVYCRRARAGEPLRVGVRLNSFKATLDRWHALVDELLHPDVCEAVSPGVLWRAYARSGYFNLSGKEPNDFSDQNRTFRNAQTLLNRCRSIGASFGAGRVGSPEAFCHHVEVWPNSWLFYQLCRLPDARALSTADDGVLLSLYERAYAAVERRPDACWFVTYTQANAGFSRLVHYQHARRHPSATDICVIPFEALEISGVDAFPPPVAITRDAERDELDVVIRAAQRILPSAYLAAAALTSTALHLDGLRERWKLAGLCRDRQVLIAEHNGIIKAAAILDFASAGVHLYGLINQAHLVALDMEGNACFDALLAAAHQRYTQRGHANFVYFKDPTAAPPGESIRHRSLGHANASVFHRRHIGDFLEHLFLTLARNLRFSEVVPRSSRPPPDSLATTPIAPKSDQTRNDYRMGVAQ